MRWRRRSRSSSSVASACASGRSACRLGAARAAPETLRDLRALCDAHPGPVPVYVHLEVDGAEVVVRSQAVSVRPSPAFVAAVEGLLGNRSVRIE